VYHTICFQLLASVSGVILTCEHASLRLPSSWKWSSDDHRRLVGTHWSYDIGSKETALELITHRQKLHEKSTVAILTRYSRLLIDPNRPKTSDTLIRTKADGKQIELNQNINEGR
jgi:predicted N-formylglutamate amidohydrolase